jgi:hypothetical protein
LEAAAGVDGLLDAEVCDGRPLRAGLEAEDVVADGGRELAGRRLLRRDFGFEGFPVVEPGAGFAGAPW